MNESTSARTKWLAPILAVIALLVIIAWMAGAFRNKIEPDTRAAPPPPAAEPVPAESREIAKIEPVPATIGARQATTISSRTLARITEITVRAGDRVKEGQLLVKLESSDLESRLQQANQRVNAVSARLKEARQNLDRTRRLYEQNLISAAARDEAQANYDALVADLANARQAAREAEVALSFAEIRSPIDGRVVERFAEPGDTASPGDKLLALYNPNTLWIEAAVPESLALSLEIGQALEVEIPALDRVLPARIEEIVPAADPGSRSFTVKAQVDDDRGLMPGMYARLLVPAGTERLLVIPEDRVVHYGQLDIVWVRTSEGVERRFIRAGRKVPAELLEVLSGLEAGELVMRPEPP